MTRVRLPLPLLACIAALLPILILLPGLHGDFLFDDLPNIVKNGALHLTGLDTDSLLQAAYSFQPGHGSRALAMLSFALDHWRAGLDPAAFKFTNLALHGLTALALVFFFDLLLRLSGWPAHRARLGAFVFSLLWAIHPLQVSTVLYTVQRMQMLGTFFLVLALWAYLKFRQAQIQGQHSRHFGLLTLLLWALALASKEDSVLLPAYTLLLEFTVLRFDAANPTIERLLRRIYLAFAVGGLAVYFLLVLPYFWHWDAYPGRTFNSPERLLTQGRVLAMYLGQILYPLPGHLPFFYDDLVVSKGLLQPWTTLPALLLVTGLLSLAWALRKRRPLFALGVLLFFAGHFITSNVIDLELAFEHRNNFPLIGAVLALGDLLFATFARINIRQGPAIGFTTLAVLLGVLTFQQAALWGNTLRLGHALVHLQPQSARAWVTLGSMYFDQYKLTGDVHSLDMAIATNQKGAQSTRSPSAYANIVLYKTLRGTVTTTDWSVLLHSLQVAPMTIQTGQMIWNMLDNATYGVPLDRDALARMIEIYSQRTPLDSANCIRIGMFLYNETDRHERAFAYLQRAVAQAPADSDEVIELLAALRAAGLDDWAQRLQARSQQDPPATGMAIHE